MKPIEANIIRSFAEVRKDVFYLQEEIKELQTEISQLNKPNSKRK